MAVGCVNILHRTCTPRQTQASVRNQDAVVVQRPHTRVIGRGWRAEPATDRTTRRSFSTLCDRVLACEGHAAPGCVRFAGLAATDLTYSDDEPKTKFTTSPAIAFPTRSGTSCRPDGATRTTCSTPVRTIPESMAASQDGPRKPAAWNPDRQRRLQARDHAGCRCCVT